MDYDDGQSRDLEQRIAQRDARHDLEIREGLRDPQTLVLVPAEMAKRAQLTFPADAFGEPQEWGAEDASKRDDSFSTT